VFEPRSNTSRRRVFQREFADALARADEAVLAAVFAKPGDPSTPEGRLDTAEIVADVSALGTSARRIDGVPAIRDYLLATSVPGDVVVVMSNGAFGGLPKLVAAGLTATAPGA
jgi:UDP-N-acetylmuramate: L-alanyl-gamma-D-glutamyl-meso-diaminopimelate ligase